MPANKKYLLTSGWAKASKVTAAILGGLILTSILHILPALLWDAELVILCVWFTFPSIWVLVMLFVYWIKSPQRVWGVISSISLIGAAIIYFIKM
ncbi:MAG: hypothetical protein AAGE93_25000 [Bacteroidota bacterium]